MKENCKRYIIFDMDGVLVNSEPVIEAAAIAGLKEYGVNAKPEDFIPFVGMGEDKYIGCVAEKYDVPYTFDMKDRVYEIYLEIVEDELGLYDGVLSVLNKLKEADFVLALASSADRIKVEANLRVAGIAMETFDVILSGEDVVRKKPSPDIYLEAARRLGADPKGCIVVEDAVNGITAGKSAGMTCIGITTSFAYDELKKAQADYICSDINEVYSVISSQIRE